MKEAKRVADETIREMNRAGVSVRELEQARNRVGGEISKKNEQLAARERPVLAERQRKLDPAKLKKGDLVYVVSMGITGTVSTLPDKKGDLFVTCGIMKSRVNVRDLAAAKEETDGKKAIREIYGSREKRGVDISRGMNISTECNLIGKTVDEALVILDRYLDEAYLAHVKSARIVHGKGTGALRNAVQKHLRQVPYISDFKLGEFGEGDSGVTVVTFGG